MPSYDPFCRGPFPVGVRTLHADDKERNREFPCEFWYPAAEQYVGDDFAAATQDTFTVRNAQRRQSAVRDAAAQAPGRYPLVLYSHAAGQHRRAATFLCTHLASHGYVVAALDHSEVVARELGAQGNESEDQKLARWDRVIASRIPDLQFLLNQVMNVSDIGRLVDSERIAAVGHSFGGWSVLALPDVEPRIGAVVAHAPAGASNPRPGILPAKLAFAWARDIPTLLLAAENDVSLPLAGEYEIFGRIPATKQMIVLRRADHLHFMDDFEATHEAFRTMPLPAALADMQKEMQPIAQLTREAQAHDFVRGTTLAHLDGVFKASSSAKKFLAGGVENELARRGIDVLLAS
jgi:predicted dienelactone hydrolase